MSTIDTPGARAHATEAVDYHLVRGALWGLLLGVGVAVYLVLFAVVAFGDWLILGGAVLAGVIVGLVWARLAPPKRGDGPPPTATSSPAVPTAAPAAAASVSESATIEADDTETVGADEPTPPDGIPRTPPPSPT
ncbi:MAG: hypothetical protein AAFY28_02690 [Actinomycetota bacterium]